MLKILDGRATRLAAPTAFNLAPQNPSPKASNLGSSFACPSATTDQSPTPTYRYLR